MEVEIEIEIECTKCQHKFYCADSSRNRFARKGWAVIDTRSFMDGDRCLIFFENGRSVIATFRNGIWQDKKNNVYGSSVVRYEKMKRTPRSHQAGIECAMIGNILNT